MREYKGAKDLYYADNNKDALREAYVNWFQLPQELDFDISPLWTQLDTLPGSMSI